MIRARSAFSAHTGPTHTGRTGPFMAATTSARPPPSSAIARKPSTAGVLVKVTASSRPPSTPSINRRAGSGSAGGTQR
jgi:hypothetical protein